MGKEKINVQPLACVKVVCTTLLPKLPEIVTGCYWMVSEDQSEGLERASMQLMCLESQIRGSPGKS